MKKRVGIMGGTFDPVHIAHLIMANEAYHALSLDEVRFMPNASPPHKTISGQTSAAERCRMIEKCIADVPYFKLDLTEVLREGKSYSFDTITHLTHQEPDTDFFFIIGGDMIESLSTWHRIEELKKMITFAGFERPGYPDRGNEDVIMIKGPVIELSSTMLRKRLLEKQDCRFLIPEKAYTYILEEGLYGS
ncbi:nicotinic acid mononucleotide adenylyltransferase [Jeotgalibacillus malaysiensis]|uniref:Probable nicotinate-nucleotide adenylyltransferase n=1 Tax=Jeotgalibacillus malaysiensis TaxID=1508404 RepID=A0A0B5AN71_9BACL|nr:nicotinate-nucleotide adenylyltransferase [Jeotgalibacillus malaysiensis]AJD91591.1 nicotinic acid mononucleotide adenylyltransferase [Jeotgalibacillus malaysiensis]